MKGWSEADVKRLEDSGRVRGVPGLANPLQITPGPAGLQSVAPLQIKTPALQQGVAGGLQQRRRGRPTKKAPGPNGLERAYRDQILAPLKFVGEVSDYHFDALTLRIGENGKKCWYHTDWLVIRPAPARLRIVEVKGHMEDDARVKLCAVARLYPWLEVYVARKVEGRMVETDWRATA